MQGVDSAIEKLTLAQVNAAWRKYIDPARMVLGWGGDFKAGPEPASLSPDAGAREADTFERRHRSAGFADCAVPIASGPAFSSTR